MGGYSVYFGDHRDVAEFLPVNELQTNIRGELRAALSALQGHIPGTKSLICPDCQLVVDGVLGLAQRWRRHNWRNTTGDVAHADPWAQILELTERYGTKIKWIHIPSHIGIRGNEKADQLADLGSRKSPLLFGRISVAPRQEDEEEERGLLEGEASVWGYEEEPPPTRGGEPPHPLPDAANTAGHATAAGWNSQSGSHCLTTVGCGSVHTSHGTQVPQN